MSRPLLLALAICVAAGCQKTTPAPPPVEPAPATDPKAESANRDVALDLSSDRIRGEIRVPEGTVIERRQLGPILLTRGADFALEVEKTKRPLSEARQSWAPRVARWVRDEPTIIVAEFQGPAGNSFAFEVRIRVGADTVRVASQEDRTFTREQVDRMLRAAQSLTQTAAIRTAIQREAKANAALKKVGGGLTDGVVTLVGDEVTDDDLAVLAGVGGVANVVVMGANRLTAHGIEGLAALRGVRVFYFDGRNVSDETVAPLRAMADLEDLHLSGPAVTDAGLAFLAGLPKLRTAWLSFKRPVHNLPRVTGAGFVHLRGHSHLATLEIGGGSMGDEALEHLATVRSLKTLNLWADSRGRITDAGLRHLAGHPNLEQLNVSGQPIRGPGLAAVASLPKLKWLNLSRCPIDDAGLATLRGAQAETLILAETAITDAGLPVLTELPGLNDLNLRGTKVTDAGLVHVGRLAKLHSLELHETPVTGTGLIHLKGLPELNSIALSDCPVTDAALAGLRDFPELAVVVMNDTAITDAALGHLQGVAKLRTVEARRSRVTAAGVRRFEEARPGARELGQARRAPGPRAGFPAGPARQTAPGRPATPRQEARDRIDEGRRRQDCRRAVAPQGRDRHRAGRLARPEGPADARPAGVRANHRRRTAVPGRADRAARVASRLHRGEGGRLGPPPWPEEARKTRRADQGPD
jgi:hypothetical protein